jgi:hypothetical protein
MSLSRYFLHDFFTAREFNELEQRERRRRDQQRRWRRADHERIQVLEDQLARVAMLARGLADACLAKGVMSRDELAHHLLEADLADGAEDGGLDPTVALPGEDRPADLRPLEGDDPPPERPGR